MKKVVPNANATIRDVARHAGVSPGSVSNYFHAPEKLGPDATQRIASAIGQLGYVGNSAARTLRIGASTTIGHLTIEVGNPLFASVAEGVERASAAAGYAVFLANSAGMVEREARYLELFEEQRVRGLVLSAVGEIESALRRLRTRGIPVVVVDQVVDPSLCASVIVDDEEGGRLAVGHLVDSGCRRILFAGGPVDIGTVAARLRGASAEAAKRGVRIERLDESERTIAAGRAVGTRLAQLDAADRPDGVFAVNDLLALGILHGLLQHGLRVPDDIALIGYDDIEFAAESVVPLSTVRRPGERFGMAAVDLLLREIRGETIEQSTVVFQPELIARASTGVHR